MENFLLRHLVGDDDGEPVSLLRGDEGEREARVAGGRLDDRAARLQLAVLLGLLDHRKTDAILDRATRIVAFELEEQLAAAGVEALGLDDRRVADQFEDALVDRHADSAQVRIVAGMITQGVEWTARWRPGGNAHGASEHRG